MIGALFGLLGVVVGGLLTAGVQTLERNVQRRHASRLVARMIFSELLTVGSGMLHALESRDLGAIEDPAVLQATWREHRRELAIPWDGWNEVDYAVVAVTSYPRVTDDDPVTGDGVDAEWRDSLQHVINAITAAQAVLIAHVS